jgi:hypothetical protein
VSIVESYGTAMRACILRRLKKQKDHGMKRYTEEEERMRSKRGKDES